MPRPLQILVLLLVLVLVLEGRAQTFVEGDYQLNRKKATAGFEVAELLAGSNVTFTWNNTNKTLTLASTNPGGTVTSFAATDSTGIDFTVTNPTTTPTLSLALTKAAVGLSNVENTALTTWTGSTALTTLGTITTGTWNATAIADTYIASAATWNAKQTALVSGTNIKTINGNSLLGSGNLTITSGIADGDTLSFGLTFPIDGLKVNDGTYDNAVNVSYSGVSGQVNFRFDPDGDANVGTILFADPNATLSLPSASATVSGTNTGDLTLAGTPDYITISGQTLTRSLINLGTHVTGTLPVANGGIHPLVTTGDNGFGYGRVGLWDADNEQWLYFNAAPSKIIFPDIQVSTIQGNGGALTGLDAGNISSGTMGVPRGGMGVNTLAANAVLIGNGTSPVQTVAPGTTGNVLTSNGTTWTSAAPATTNPAGSGSELQFRSSGTAFGALTNSTATGSALFLGAGQALATTSTAIFTARNTTAATVGVPVQVSPSIVLEGQGWKTDATAASQTVRFRENVLPVQGTANPSATWQLQSEINNSGTFANRVTVSSLGVLSVSGDSNTVTIDAKDSNNNISATRHITITPGNGWTLFLNSSVQVPSANTFGFSSDVVLGRDAANTLAQRNSTAAQIFRLYETDSGANDEYLELTAASGTNLIRPQATGTGTASVVRYHTTTAVFWTSGSGSPESVVTAPVGSLYTRTDGGAATTLYVKESGTGSTGWVAK